MKPAIVAPAAAHEPRKARGQSDFLDTVPTSARGIVQRAFAGTASPRAAIKAKCLDCSCFDRDEVAHCAVILCPLHPYRPFQKARNGPKSARGSDLCATSPAAGPAPTGGLQA